jgi:hypothetical protein
MNVQTLKIYKYTFYLVALFFILYVDSLRIIGVDVLNLLQILLFAISLFIVQKKLGWIPPELRRVSFLGLLASTFGLLHLNSLGNISDDLGFVTSTATIPIFLPFIYYYLSRKTLADAQLMLLAVTSFYIFSSLPFLFGILDQKEGAEDILWKYGLEEGKEVFFGFYGSVANSSKIISVSLLTAFVFFLERKKTIFLTLLVLVGSYTLIYTFARTGWFTFLGGLFILYIGGRNWKEVITKVVPVIAMSALIVGFIISQNEFISRRIQGNKVYNEKSDVSLIESYENSRLGIQGAAMAIIGDMSLSELFLGIGLRELKFRMGTYFGSGIVPHNKILMIIIGGGLKMLFIYFLYVVSLYKFIKRYSSISYPNNFVKLPIILFLIFLLTQIPSHGFEFFSSIIFALAIVVCIRVREVLLYNSH